MQPDDDQLVGGTVLRRPAIRSPNFVTGVSGWTINIDGSAEFSNVVLRGELTLISAVDADTVVATRHPTDAFDVFSINVLGTMGWGPGNVTTDAYLARIDVGTMELAERLQVRGFGALTNTGFNVIKDGEGNGRWFVRINGQNRWSDGTNPSDTDLGRLGAAVLGTSGRFQVGGSAKDVAASTLANAAGLYAGSNTSTSTSYANLGSPASIASFIKQFTATAIIVWFNTTVTAVTAAAAPKFGVQINGVDYDVCLLNEILVGDNLQCSGVAIVAPGLAAGTYTIQGRFKRNGGTGTVTLNTNDWVTIAAMEVSQ